MSNIYISINQFAEFSVATDASKRRILKQQKIPNKLLIPWYQRAKGAIKKFLIDVEDYSIIDDAIQILRAKTPVNNRQKIDREVSIEALEKLKQMELPSTLKNLNYQIITSTDKSLLINDVDIIIAPEVIIKAFYKGEIVYGAIKIHISKGKPFDFSQATSVATAIQHFLSKKVATKGERVLPELCLCLDVFSGRLVQAPDKSLKEINKLKIICTEIKQLWATS